MLFDILKSLDILAAGGDSGGAVARVAAVVEPDVAGKAKEEVTKETDQEGGADVSAEHGGTDGKASEDSRGNQEVGGGRLFFW